MTKLPIFPDFRILTNNIHSQEIQKKEIEQDIHVVNACDYKLCPDAFLRFDLVVNTSPYSSDKFKGTSITFLKSWHEDESYC